ncbi:MAG: PEP-CTERM sorting domain-containing protein [Phycisphaerales bacterium]|nr:PEP-CTERM sorting domain-containing protein [Planctomycetota bacterium]
MKKMIVCAAVCVAAASAQAVVVNVDPSGPGYLGYMNVFELPSNGGGYVFGSPWGTPDLTATFDDGLHTLTLGANHINDPSPFWYTPSGGPGATGNKIMQANLYHEVTDSYSGQTVTFEGTVLSNTFDSAHVGKLFIRDFAADYSSSVDTFIDMNVGNFSFSLNTLAGPGRHVQWGFQVTGPCVWVTDVDAAGTAVIATVPAPASLGLLSVGLIGAARRRRS